VVSVTRTTTGFAIRTEGLELDADALVLATPAFVTADLLDGVAPDAAGMLRSIRYASTAVVVLVYEEGTATRVPNGSGFVAPREALEMTACSFVSRKWPDEAFGDRAVLRCFVGADGVERESAREDEALVSALGRRLAGLLPLPQVPDHARVVRWPRSMPQYDVGHLELVDGIDRAMPPGVFVTGSAFRGVGVPDCVRDAGTTAGRVLERLG
jgi:oxygen-dependent protoporphyrinogen oxidase